MTNHNLLVVIHSDGLKKVNDEDKGIVDIFFKCSELDEILMLATPTTDSDWLAPYKRIVYTSYEDRGDKSFVAKYKTQTSESGVLFHNYVPKAMITDLYGCQEDSLEFMEASKAFHDLLAFEAMSRSKSHSIFVTQSPCLLEKNGWIQKRFEVKILSFLQALEYIDLYLKRLDPTAYYAAPHYRIVGGNAFYYWFLLRDLVPKFTEAWTISVFGKNHIQNGEKVQNILSGFASKFENALCSSDRIAIEYMKRPNNLTEWEMLFNLNYFCMLATGIFDLLAWLAVRRYSIPIHRPHEVSIHTTDYKSKGTKFINSIARYNQPLASFIVQQQDFIHMFYPMRNAIQHREPIEGARFVQATEGWTVSVATLEQDVVDVIRMVDRSGYPFTKFGLLNKKVSNLLEPYRFTRRALRDLITLSNTFLELLDFPSLIARNQDLIDRITHVKSDENRTPFIAKAYWNRDCYLPILFQNK